MKIQCILIRNGGTKADIDGIEYHFEPLEDGAHVADIEREDHIDRFLAIPEGYKIYHGKLSPSGKPQAVSERAAAPVETPAQAKPHQLAGSASHAPQYEINGRVYPLMEVIEMAFEASGMTADEWNFADEDDRAARIDIALDDLADAAPASPEPFKREALVAAYLAKFGKKPHHKKSDEAIKAELDA